MHQKIQKKKIVSLKEEHALLNFVMIFNDPAPFEVAAVLERTDVAPPSHRRLAVIVKQGKMQKINYNSMDCNDMYYALVWPCGEMDGIYTCPLKVFVKQKYRRQSLSESMFCTDCEGQWLTVTNPGELTQQLFVDYFTLIEDNRLKYIQQEQTELFV